MLNERLVLCTTEKQLCHKTTSMLSLSYYARLIEKPASFKIGFSFTVVWAIVESVLSGVLNLLKQCLLFCYPKPPMMFLSSAVEWEKHEKKGSFQ